MPATDMLDVIHYFFEDDANYSTAEQAKARTGMRTQIYENLYNTTYKYGGDEDTSSTEGEVPPTRDFGSIDEDEILDPINPFAKKSKSVAPYTPPTQLREDDVNPFGDVLDAPLR
jgi:hypothetical protein